MAPRPCIVTGCPHYTTAGSRCAAHRRQAERAKQARRPVTSAERARRARAVAEHVRTRGWWCPGWRDQPPHTSSDLTADHVWPVAAGGPEAGPLVVRCRRCNSARGARTG